MKTAQERIAELMYETHRDWVKKMVRDVPDLPDWEDTDIIVKAYWISIAECSLEILAEPDPQMIAAVIAEMKKPQKVTAKTWEAHREADFLRYNIAALEAARIKISLKSKKPE